MAANKHTFTYLERFAISTSNLTKLKTLDMEKTNQPKFQWNLSKRRKEFHSLENPKRQSRKKADTHFRNRNNLHRVVKFKHRSTTKKNSRIPEASIFNKSKNYLRNERDWKRDFCKKERERETKVLFRSSPLKFLDELELGVFLSKVMEQGSAKNGELRRD